jgi:hypothetical protein
MPLLEAMATGVACLTTRVGTALDMVEDGSNADFISFDDPQAIVDRSLELANNEALRSRIGETARASMASQRSWEQMVPSASSLYRVALANGRDRLASRPQADPARQALARRWTRWMAAREHYSFSRDLSKMQEYTVALDLAQRARRENPLDARLWWHEGKTWLRSRSQ